jgi:ribosome recycling factor
MIMANDKSSEATPEKVLSDTNRRMDRSLESLKQDLSTLRTGRATPALVENLMVEYYGTSTPLKQIASISAPDPRAVLVQPWDKGSLQEIEKSIMKSEMGFNPSNDGNSITIPMPALNKERRQEMVRLLKKKIEDGKVAIRNVRRDGVDSLKKMEKDKTISQDQNRRAQEQLQKATDGHTKQADEVSVAKEAEIMQV